MLNILKQLIGFMIVPKSGTSEADEAGQLEVLSSDSKLRYHNGTSSSPVVTEDHAATLTNKTMTSPVINTGVSGTAIDTDGTLAANSDTKLASQKATKTYADSVATTAQTNLTNHIEDTEGAHAGTAISNTPAGTIAATTVQAAINELDGDVQTVQTNLTNHITDSEDAHDASAISFTPVGDITSNNVQDAIPELGTILTTEIDTVANDLTTHEAETAAHGATGTVVGTTNTQTLTNKTLTSPIINNGSATGTSIETPARADVKQDTKANLLTYAASATNGQLVFATDEKKMYQVIDNALAEVGGGGQSLDTFVQLTADEELTDWASGNNATFLGGGTIAGTFAKETTNPLNGDASYKYTQAVGSANDYIASPVQDVPIRFRGNEATVFFPYLYDGNNDDIALVVYDVTNATTLTQNSVYGLDATGNNASVYKANISIPLTCTQIRVGFQVIALNSGKILQFDDIQITSDATVYADLLDSQSSYLGQSSVIGAAVITGALSSSNGSGLYSYNSSTGVYTMLKSGNVNISASLSTNAAASVQPIIYINGTATTSSYGLATTNVFTTTSWSGKLEAGNYFQVNNGGPGNSDRQRITVLVTANVENIVTEPETFSTDTSALTYASSSQYTLSTLANAPVGTFITFTYAASTNTRTQTTTAPTQTTSSMNTNGIQIFTRAHNAASTAGNPSTVAIQIGKGLKGYSLNLYKSTGKTTEGEWRAYNDGNSGASGIDIVSYNEVTGVLYIDAGIKYNSTFVSSTFRFSDVTAQTNGYLTINASKNPALTGINIGTVAARAVNTSGQSIVNGVSTVMTYDATKTYDTHNALNTTTGVFTAPESGYYIVSWTMLLASSANFGAGESFYSRLTKNGSDYATGYLTMSEAAVSKQMSTVGSTGVFLAKGDTVSVYGSQNSGVNIALDTNSTNNHFSIHKTI